MGYQTTEDGTRIVASPQWAFGQKSLSRIDNGTVAMNVNGEFTGTKTVLWNGTGENDTGGDWTHSGEGSENTSAKKTGTNGLNTTITDEDDESIFDNGSMVDVAGTYTALQFWIRAKVYPVGSDPTIFWRNSSNAQVGDKLHLNDYVEDFDDDWQLISLPITDFDLGANVQKLVFKFEGVGGQRYYLDDIELYQAGGGPYTFQVAAPAGLVYHVKELVLTIVEENGSWAAGDFTGITGGLETGLLLRHRRLSTAEVLWKINLKTNINLFGRLDVRNDVEYSTVTHGFKLVLVPDPAVLTVTDDAVLEVLVRDDLTSINGLRSFIQFGQEEAAA